MVKVECRIVLLSVVYLCLVCTWLGGLKAVEVPRVIPEFTINRTNVKKDSQLVIVVVDRLECQSR